MHDDTTTPDERAERSVLLDVELDRALDALESPDLLSAWLGDWTTDPDDPDAATVVTDDGVTRRVRRGVATSPNEVVWRWSPVADPGATSDVRFIVTTEGAGTRLTVIESRLPATVAAASVRSAAPTAPAVSWLRSLMALGAVLAVGSLVPV